MSDNHYELLVKATEARVGPDRWTYMNEAARESRINDMRRDFDVLGDYCEEQGYGMRTELLKGIADAEQTFEMTDSEALTAAMQALAGHRKLDPREVAEVNRRLTALCEEHAEI